MICLGCDRYGAVGNDVGSNVSREPGVVAPDRVIGVRVGQAFSLPSGEPGKMEDLAAERWTVFDRGGHFHGGEVPAILVADIHEFFREVR